MVICFGRRRGTGVPLFPGQKFRIAQRDPPLDGLLAVDGSIPYASSGIMVTRRVWAVSMMVAGEGLEPP